MSEQSPHQAKVLTVSDSVEAGNRDDVTGRVVAETARLAGRIEGAITARELVVLRTARIHGDVQYDALTIEQGALVDGKLTPRGAQPGHEGAGTHGPDMLIVSQDPA